MIVVSDTSPVNYLLAIGQIELLPRLFEEVILPAAVVAELQTPDAPDINRRWLANLPGSFQVRAAARVDESLNLDAGEREAICLAEELHAAAILIDEKKGRAAARQRGLPVVGTLGVLERASAQGLVDMESALAALQPTSSVRKSCCKRCCCAQRRRHESARNPLREKRRRCWPAHAAVAV